jgi:hypothetical protein
LPAAIFPQKNINFAEEFMLLRAALPFGTRYCSYPARISRNAANNRSTSSTVL